LFFSVDVCYKRVGAKPRKVSFSNRRGDLQRATKIKSGALRGEGVSKKSKKA
jgi:hypothetical protein